MWSRILNEAVGPTDEEHNVIKKLVYIYIYIYIYIYVFGSSYLHLFQLNDILQ